MPKTNKNQLDHNYQIKIYGNFDQGWSRWFNGMAISTEEDSHGAHITSLTGRITDQAKLRGVMNKIWDLNLIVISLNRCED